MANDFYTVTGTPATSSAGSSAAMRAELALIAAGFDKMPTLTANANQVIHVNSSGTALTNTAGFTMSAAGLLTVPNGVTVTAGGLTVTAGGATITAGGFTVTAGATTISGALTASPANQSVTFSPTGTGTVTINPATAGTINNVTIGATTRGAGNFTSLDANAAVGLSPANAAVTISPSGTGTVTINPATAGTINAMSIGATTRSTGAFTTLTANNTVTLSPANANVVMSPTGTGVVTINPATAGAMDNVVIGGTTKLAGGFTTLTATGASTLAAVNQSGDYNINSGKFTVAAASGNTVVAGTLGVTGSVTAGTAGSSAHTFNGLDKILTIASSSATANALFRVKDSSANKFSFGYNKPSSADSFVIYDDTNSTYLMTLIAGGNAALGMSVLSNHGAGGCTLELGQKGNGVTASTVASYVRLHSNAYNNGGYKYATTAVAGMVEINGDVITIQTAASGTADNALTWTERVRITSAANGGYFKASNSGSYVSATGTYHELVSNDGSNVVARIYNTHASTPQGLLMVYSGAAPNGTGNIFLSCQDNAAVRFELRSNGGLANFSANNVNLSDERVKPWYEAFAANDGRWTPRFASLWEAHKRMRGVWGVFKYDDQTHDDWNYGYTAQGVRQAFSGVADELVDLWSDTDERGLLAVYAEDLKNITGAIVTELQFGFEDLRGRVEMLEAEVLTLRKVA